MATRERAGGGCCEACRMWRGGRRPANPYCVWPYFLNQPDAGGAAATPPLQPLPLGWVPMPPSPP